MYANLIFHRFTDVKFKIFQSIIAWIRPVGWWLMQWRELSSKWSLPRCQFGVLMWLVLSKKDICMMMMLILNPSSSYNFQFFIGQIQYLKSRTPRIGNSAIGQLSQQRWISSFQSGISLVVIFQSIKSSLILVDQLKVQWKILRDSYKRERNRLLADKTRVRNKGESSKGIKF